MVKQDDFDNRDDLPPFFKSWKGLYLFVLGHLVFLMAAFYLFTKFFE